MRVPRLERKHCDPLADVLRANVRDAKRVQLKADARSPLQRRLYQRNPTPFHEKCLPNSIPHCTIGLGKLQRFYPSLLARADEVIE